MDIIVTDKHGHDSQCIQDFELDVAFGESENDFELVIPEGLIPELKNGTRWYMDGSDVGGIIDGVSYEYNRFGKVTTYTGRTWQGVLSHKIITPPRGQAHLSVNGEANSIIRDLITTLGLTSCYVASTEDSGVNINYQFHRYTDAYNGLINMLASANAILCIKCVDEKVILSAMPSTPYKLYSEQREFKLERVYRCTNHLVCLGSGELEQRVVVHLYANSRGAVSQTQSIKGLNEIAETYDSNGSDEADLIENGTKKLKELQVRPKVEISIDDDSLPLNVGETIIAEDKGAVVEGVIIKKVIKYERGNATYKYEIG